QCDLKSGQMDVALKERQRVELEERKRELENDYGYHETQYVDREEVRAIVGSERYVAGLLDMGSGHLHTLNYTLGLADAAHRAGVKIHEASPAERVQRDVNGKIVVHTPEGQAHRRYRLLCGTAYIVRPVPAITRT